MDRYRLLSSLAWSLGVDYRCRHPLLLLLLLCSLLMHHNIMYLARNASRQHVVAARHCFSTNHAGSGSNLMETATDYFSSLRWRATEALTSLMTKEEREELLKRMDVFEDKNAKQVVNEEEVQKTIAEAVVAARAEEAQKQKALWEREKERLHAQAEQAAYERVEADLRIQQQRAAALERWKADVAKEVNDNNAADQQQAREHHPVLGEEVADFGFKRLHVVSAKTLSNIPVWKKQRIYRHDRAKAMAADKMKTAHFGLPGVIALHEVSRIMFWMAFDVVSSV